MFSYHLLPTKISKNRAAGWAPRNTTTEGGPPAPPELWGGLLPRPQALGGSGNSRKPDLHGRAGGFPSSRRTFVIPLASLRSHTLEREDLNKSHYKCNLRQLLDLHCFKARTFRTSGAWRVLGGSVQHTTAPPFERGGWGSWKNTHLMWKPCKKPS